MPNMPLNRSAISISTNIFLADSHFDSCRRVDMLVGAGLFWKVLCVGQHKAGPELLWQKTQFGWVLGGKLTWPASHAPNLTNRCNLQVVTNSELQGQLERFWKIEELPRTNNQIDDCEAHFLETAHRDSSGRYVVSIPFKDNLTKLGNSRDQAERRLLALERKMVRQPELREQYVQFMNEYETLGHMSQVSDTYNASELNYYLPHHAVYKHSSTTTKLRVVFDGSAKSSSGLALNNTQLVGPTVQSDLFSILIRFRLHKYVLSADIAKMYRQLLVEVKDRRFQRILWRRNTTDPIQTYELNTVTYGTASATFLATRVLHQVGLECAERLPETSRIIINDFYVDDLLTGTETILDAQKLKDEITNILEQAGFQLRKWATNSPNILKNMLESVEEKEISIDKDPKTLGLLWSPDEDLLRFSLSFEKHRRVTKRVILSEIAQIFDPLGIIGPIITRAKIIMQELWQLKTGWDESISQELHTQWQQYRNDLQELVSLKIPRGVAMGKLESTEIHGFSDASERAYGACVYLRSLTTSGIWEVRLLCAKSRVAPLKTISVPRLELCGALLLAQLVDKVKRALSMPINSIRYWSDSTVTLTWLKQSPSRWNTFVANRVSEIQVLSDSEHWYHVASQDNPADMISRGTAPSLLASADIWWAGPAWLSMDCKHWTESKIQTVDAPEERQVNTTMVVFKIADDSIFKRFSSYSRLVRVTAYCLRFFNNLRGLHKSKSNQIYKTRALAIAELRLAEETLLRLAQEEGFSEELSALQKTRSLPRSSTLLSLNPFLDSVGLIRVGGRLGKARIVYSKKHPVILPRKHPLTDLIIRYEHIRLLHAGSELVMASLREKYWPLACRRNIRRIVRSCVKCFKVNPRGIECIMGELPAARVTPARAFHTCGIDYAGPFLTKERTRSKVTTKSYLCVFVCFVTKAVHLELATDLSTEAFLNCFRRFIARRGRSHCIVTDNGTNFIGARNELKELGTLLNSNKYNSKISNLLSEERVEWRLSPPHAPHFEGLWESGVKSAKYHLKRIIGEQRLTFEELYTLLTQVESCLNSRPISPISSDPNDLNPLTPGHFLIGDAPTALPSHDLTDIKTNRLSRFQLIQQMFQHFWQRWKREYLHQLQQRSKWRTSSPQALEVGTLVLIKEDNLPPLRWRLGRIKELHLGTDGGARVATVKTADGIFKRPVAKLCMLPIEDTDSKSDVNDSNIDKI
ncbi:uncharacterized protein LOC143261233 [Megalopta genalis]|uniref:uncharacterized protein LOC143261233 n=1 Tax=Megalopta genalis TaxID=115081 RepID=UPI003FD34A76